MICKDCGTRFAKIGNRAVRLNGDKIIVCPNCGKEEIEQKNQKIHK